MKSKILITIYIILAILSCAYGALVLSAGAGTFFFLFWFALGAFFVFLAIAVKQGLWKKLSKTLKTIFLVLLATGTISFILVECLIASGFTGETQTKFDYIIVLGAQVYENGPSPVLRYRLEAALECLEQNPEALCIVTGGQGFNEPFPEAEGMADYLISAGIDEARIIKETASKSTAENIENSMPFIKEGASVGIVSNNFHIYRALQIAKKQGLENVYGIPAYSSPLYLPNNMTREFFAEIKFLLF